LELNHLQEKWCWHFIWDAQGSIFKHYQERGTTVHSVLYSEMLQDHLKPAVQIKCWGWLSKGIAMLYSKTHPHIVTHTAESLHQPNFEVLEDLPCNRLLNVTVLGPVSGPPLYIHTYIFHVALIWLLTVTCFIHSKTLKSSHFASD
jgi:hypothetical protein